MFILSALEIVAYYVVIYNTDERFSKDSKMVMVWSSLMIIEGTLVGYFNVPLRMLWGFLFAVIAFKVLMRIPYLQGLFLHVFVIVILATVQICQMVVLLIVKNTTYSFFNGVIINSILIVAVYFIVRIFPLNKVLVFYLKKQSFINTLMFVLLVPVVFYSIIWDSNQANSWQYVSLIFTAIIIWTLIVIILFLEIVKINEGRKIAKIYNEYYPILERLIDEVKTKQHDYKNHLQALYSIAELDRNTQIATYIEDVMQTSYKNEKFLNTNNNIISALLYSKNSELQSKNIEFEFIYDMPLPSYPLKDYEMVEVIGNLIDNAKDAALVSGDRDKRITITMKNDSDHKIIEVANTGLPISQDMINNILKKGYSTKGDNRGYGLYNINKIVESYYGKIEIVNSVGWITVTLVFP